MFRLSAFCFLAARLVATLLMDLPPPHLPAIEWLHQARIRIVKWWPVKLVGTTLVMTGFFLGYFWVLNHPLFPVTTMPLTALDRLIAFRPELLPVYLSLWFYVALAPALLITWRELVSYAVATAAMGGIGLGIFFLWPTTVVWPEDWSQHAAFAFLKQVDASGNACPSLHVAFAVFTAIWLERLLRQMRTGRAVRKFNWLWCLGILYSTVAIRQHVVLDVFAGAVLGSMVALLHLRWLRG